MTISNTSLPNLADPGATTQSPLTGNEIVPIFAGPITNRTTIAALADTAIVDQTVTASGTTQANAYPIVAQITNFTTVASGKSCLLPTATKPGMRRTIFNNGANVLTVFASGTDTIDGTAGSTGVALTNALRCQYICVASGVWISAQLGVVSA